MAVVLTDANFDELVINSKQPVLVDFWAEWCGPCRMVGPVVEELAKEYEGKAVIGKMDVDNNPKIATEYGIMSIPALLFFKDGKVVDKQIGLAPVEFFEEAMNQLSENGSFTFGHWRDQPFIIIPFNFLMNLYLLSGCGD